MRYEGVEKGTHHLRLDEHKEERSDQKHEGGAQDTNPITHGNAMRAAWNYLFEILLALAAMRHTRAQAPPHHYAAVAVVWVILYIYISSNGSACHLAHYWHAFYWYYQHAVQSKCPFLFLPFLSALRLSTSSSTSSSTSFPLFIPSTPVLF